MSIRFNPGEEGVGVEFTLYKPGVKFAAGSCIPLEAEREKNAGRILNGLTMIHGPERRFGCWHSRTCA